MIADRLLVKPFDVQEEDYLGVIHIPAAVRGAERHWRSKKGYAHPWKARVVDVGPKVHDLKPGDWVLVSNYGKTEVFCDPEGLGNSQLHFIVREQTVMVKFETEGEL